MKSLSTFYTLLRVVPNQAAGEADDDDVHVRFASSFRGPREGPMGERDRCFAGEEPCEGREQRVTQHRRPPVR